MSLVLLNEAEFWKGRDGTFASELTPAIREAAAETLRRVDGLLVHAGLASAHINSGWRPAAVNAKVPGAAKRSRHMTGEAVDIADGEGTLAAWVLGHLEALEHANLFIEHPLHTPRWVHFQTAPPRSGRRVFIP